VRWRVWHRDGALIEAIARKALSRAGVCNESDSVIRFVWDRASGHLVVMVYLMQFDLAVWKLSRHIEHYVMRQFKGLHGVTVHSVHVSVGRAHAFQDVPRVKTGAALRVLLRDMRQTLEPGKAATAGPATKPVNDRAEAERDDRSQRSPYIKWLPTEEYHSVPGYDLSEMEMEELLNSRPYGDLPAFSETSPDPSGVLARSTEHRSRKSSKPARPTPRAEADVIKPKR
jgi:hypothetical protein